MGFFGKLKENIKHGGIKVQLQAPASVSMNEPTVPVTVTVSASDEQETIERIVVSIIAETFDRGFSSPDVSNPNNRQGQESVVAEANDMQPFTLMPGETKSVQLNIVMNQGASMAAQIPEGSGMAQVAGMLQKIQSVSEVMNNNSYRYFLRATAKVEGIALSPSQQQPLQILKPGEVGGAFFKRI